MLTRLFRTQPEFAHPYEVLKDHTEITIASPNGSEAPLDPGSVDASKDDSVSVKFLNNSQALWKNTEKLSTFLGRAGEFEAIFFVGGHGRKAPLYLPSESKRLTRYSNVGLSDRCHLAQVD